MGEPLELEAEVGDIYQLTYEYQGQITTNTSGTKSLQSYYFGVEEIKLIRVEKTNPGQYRVRLKVEKSVADPEAMFDVPGFRFNKMEESESMVDRVLSTIIGIFMGA